MIVMLHQLPFCHIARLSCTCIVPARRSNYLNSFPGARQFLRAVVFLHSDLRAMSGRERRAIDPTACRADKPVAALRGAAAWRPRTSLQVALRADSRTASAHPRKNCLSSNTICLAVRSRLVAPLSLTLVGGTRKKLRSWN
jgi:hypothetical protein